MLAYDIRGKRKLIHHLARGDREVEPSLLVEAHEGDVIRPGRSSVNACRMPLIRLRRNGTVLKKDFYLDLSNPLSDKKNPNIQNGDTIFVKTNKFA